MLVQNKRFSLENPDPLRLYSMVRESEETLIFSLKKAIYLDPTPIDSITYELKSEFSPTVVQSGVGSILQTTPSQTLLGISIDTLLLGIGLYRLVLSVMMGNGDRISECFRVEIKDGSC